MKFINFSSRFDTSFIKKKWSPLPREVTHFARQNSKLFFQTCRNDPDFSAVDDKTSV